MVTASRRTCAPLLFISAVLLLLLSTTTVASTSQPEPTQAPPPPAELEVACDCWTRQNGQEGICCASLAKVESHQVQSNFAIHYIVLKRPKQGGKPALGAVQFDWSFESQSSFAVVTYEGVKKPCASTGCLRSEIMWPFWSGSTFDLSAWSTYMADSLNGTFSVRDDLSTGQATNSFSRNYTIPFDAFSQTDLFSFVVYPRVVSGQEPDIKGSLVLKEPSDPVPLSGAQYCADTCATCDSRLWNNEGIEALANFNANCDIDSRDSCPTHWRGSLADINCLTCPNQTALLPVDRTELIVRGTSSSNFTRNEDNQPASRRTGYCTACPPGVETCTGENGDVAADGYIPGTSISTVNYAHVSTCTDWKKRCIGLCRSAAGVRLPFRATCMPPDLPEVDSDGLATDLGCPADGSGQYSCLCACDAPEETVFQYGWVLMSLAIIFILVALVLLYRYRTTGHESARKLAMRTVNSRMSLTPKDAAKIEMQLRDERKNRSDRSRARMGQVFEERDDSVAAAEGFSMSFGNVQTPKTPTDRKKPLAGAAAGGAYNPSGEMDPVDVDQDSSDSSDDDDSDDPFCDPTTHSGQQSRRLEDEPLGLDGFEFCGVDATGGAKYREVVSLDYSSPDGANGDYQ